MALDGESSIDILPPEKLSETSTFECITFKMKKHAYMIIFGLTVMLTFDLLTLKSNQLIFVPNFTKAVHLVKFPQVVCKISYSQTFRSMITHGFMDSDSPTTECLRQLLTGRSTKILTLH